jgi:uncharacterized protein with HEPN domain
LQFAEGMTFEAFTAYKKTTSAVIRAPEVVGEATKQLPPRMREKYPDVSWREMTGMRDRLIHDYSGVDPAIVWETLTRFILAALPQLTIIREVEAKGLQP